MSDTALATVYASQGWDAIAMFCGDALLWFVATSLSLLYANALPLSACITYRLLDYGVPKVLARRTGYAAHRAGITRVYTTYHANHPDSILHYTI